MYLIVTRMGFQPFFSAVATHFLSVDKRIFFAKRTNVAQRVVKIILFAPHFAKTNVAQFPVSRNIVKLTPRAFFVNHL